ncbi:hypothetical protein K461DRAFT_279680 [Myriangium duriaei CBS 260.36]|uniref:Uncharacterized protein n=1 Tax=Myriangium duriaei CBS 260.36 TaxID=1168546 RepID=A0A9P4J130_9PEZI|nr:hypothetical protein K461DRAFT_279680 [Myriangium duriaei CBS 260.36]
MEAESKVESRSDSLVQKDAASPPPTKPETTTSLPQRFTVFKTETGGVTHVALGQSKNQLQNAITTGTSAGGTHDVIHRTLTLHAGADPTSPPLATAVNRWTTGRTVKVDLAGQGGSPPLEVTLQGHSGVVHPTYEFVLRIGGPDEPRQIFEWSGTAGSGIKSAIGHKTGWKLCNAQGEVLAYWGTKYGTWRLTGDFAFVGKGATGELGQQWQSMTVVSSLMIGVIMRSWVIGVGR